MLEAHVLEIEFLRALLGAIDERRNALDAVELADERRQHGGLIAATRADLEHFVDGAELEQRFGHARNDVRLRDRLPKADRQCRVLVGTTAQSLIHENVPGYVPHAIEHGEVRDAL